MPLAPSMNQPNPEQPEEKPNEAGSQAGQVVAPAQGDLTVETQAAPAPPPAPAPGAAPQAGATQSPTGGSGFAAALEYASQVPDPMDEQATQAWNQANLGQKAAYMLGGAMAGGAKATTEAIDLVVGKPYSWVAGAFGAEHPDDYLPDFAKKYWEATDYNHAAFNKMSWVTSVTEGVSQFATGMIGLNKFLKGGKLVAEAAGLGEGIAKGAKFLEAGGKLAKIGTTVAEGVAVGNIAFDPYQQRMANFLATMGPEITQPVMEYLATDWRDSEADARLKLSLESIGMDVAVGTAFRLIMKGYKAYRGGDKEAGDRLFNAALEAGDPTVLERKTPIHEAPVVTPRPIEDVKVAPHEVTAEQLSAGPLGHQQKVGQAEVAAIPLGVPGPAALGGRGFGQLDTQLTRDNWFSFPGEGADPADLARLREFSPGHPIFAGEGAAEPSVFRGEGADQQGFASPGEATTSFPGEAPGGMRSEGTATAGQPITPLAPNIPSTRGKATADGTSIDLTGGRPGDTVAPGGRAVPGGDSQRAGAGLAPDAGGVPGARVQAESTGAPGRAPGDTLAQAEAAPTRAAEKAPAAGGASLRTAPRIPVESLDIKDVDAFLKNIDADEAALKKYGGYDAASAAGHRFAESVLPYQKVNTSDKMKVALGRLAEAIEPTILQVRGGKVQSDKVNDAVAYQLGEFFKQDPETIMGVFARAGTEAPLLAATATAGRQVGMALLSDAMKLASEIKNGTLKQGDLREANLRIKGLIASSAEAGVYAGSIVTNGARTVRRGHYGLSQQQYEHILGMSDEAAVNLLNRAGGDWAKLRQMIRPGFWKRVQGVITHLAMSDLLWAIPTHTYNFVTNSGMLALQPTTKLVGGAIMAGEAKLWGHASKPGVDAMKRGWYEYGKTVISTAEAFRYAKDTFINGDSKLLPHTMAFENMGTAGGKLEFRKIEEMMDVAYYAQLATGMPLRTLGASDEFFKTLRARGVLQARFTVDGMNMGLKDKGLKDFIAKRMDDSFGENGELLDTGAAQEARVATFSDPLESKWGQTIQGVVNKHPAARIVVPFVRTALKSLNQSINMTPVLNLMKQDYRARISGERGIDEQAKAYGEMALGAVTWAALYDVVNNLGFDITGGFDKSANVRRQEAVTGFKPYSFHWKSADGTDNYIPLSRFDPFGVHIGVIADLRDIAAHPLRFDDVQNLAVGSIMAMVNQVTNRTSLIGITNAMEAINDPLSSRAIRFLGGIGEQLTPFSSLIRQINPDPYIHETRTLLDSYMSRMFGAGMPLQRDFMGRPVLKQPTMYTTGSGSPVETEVLRLAIATGWAPDTPEYGSGGVDFRDVRTDDGKMTAYDRLGELSWKPPGADATMEEALEAVINSDDYQVVPDASTSAVQLSKNAMLSSVVERYRKAARQALLEENPHLRDLINARENAALGQTMENIKKQKLQSQQAKGVQNLINSVLPPTQQQ